MDLEIEPSAGTEQPPGIAGDGPVENQRISVLDEERLRRFVTRNIHAYRGVFAAGDIGGIGNDQVELFPLSGE